MSDEHALTDIFFDIYRFAEISGEIYGLENFSQQKKINFHAQHAYIHIIQNASCRLKIKRLNLNLILKTGDIVVLPTKLEHSIEIVSGQTMEVSVISCIFQLKGIYGEAIAEGLPTYIHVPSHHEAEKIAEWVPMTVAAIKLELEHPALGSRVMLSRIIDLLLVWSIRFWLATEKIEHQSWISALRDPIMSKALSLMHAQPAYEWDVNSLAQLTKQSRSSFSKKFVELVGVPPMLYLKNWRMKLACQLLKETDKNIAQIAELVGYSSQAAFSRAFAQSFGCAPKTFRAAINQEVF
ncbi:helix-turn-helix transcriptional regulator [Acinetobacter dispersus]|uniref:helix-turn-helix transcriptional regulator n=1 Tax=Acinetobacter dispersus TaxID=70348 RepID=UPI0021CDD3CE|nr:AraC family transcriptional regulator [Acinetobacter dispersus]MCU4335650.1 AraC family transcriptional regulator [Acinetobacter dispersus]